MDKIIILNCGASCSGKTTYAKKFIEENPQYLYLNADKLRGQLGQDENDQTVNYKVFKLLEEMAIYFMSLNYPILVDNCNYNRQNRKMWVKLARQYGYKIVANVFKTPLDVCLARNEVRTRKVDISIIRRQFDNFQTPTLDEVDDIIEIMQ